MMVCAMCKKVWHCTCWDKLSQKGKGDAMDWSILFRKVKTCEEDGWRKVFVKALIFGNVIGLLSWFGFALMVGISGSFAIGLLALVEAVVILIATLIAWDG